MESAPDAPEALAKNEDKLRKLVAAGEDGMRKVWAATAAAKEATTSKLYQAVAKQDVGSASILLNLGADVNGPNAEGFPPLRAAVVRNNVALVMMLLARGADVNHRYTITNGTHKETKTVLFEAMAGSTYELLLKNGADVHVKNSWHETPLHFQCYNWSSRLVRALLSAGADVNAVNKKSSSPLDNAIFRKPSQRKADDEEFMEVCRLLLRHKAVVSWADPDEYFRAKGKADSSSDAVKARLQLVHEWEGQRKRGNTSFKLPIEVFRRGALDIATYYSALNRGGRDREVLEHTRSSALDNILQSFGGMDDADDSDSSSSSDSDDDLSMDLFQDIGSFVSRSVSEKIRKLASKTTSGGGEESSAQVGGSSWTHRVSSPTTRGGSSWADADKGTKNQLVAKAPKKKWSKGKAARGRTRCAPPGRATNAQAHSETLDASPVRAHRVIGGGRVSSEAKPASSVPHFEDNPETSPMRRTLTGSCRSSVEASSAPSEVKEAEAPELQSLMYRCKVCVVGPSRWGKTSFIKSFTSGTSTLEDVDVRTIGIDLFPWSFDVETEAGDCEYQVSFWDFAGQEEYRAAHTLFYSSRTLYLLCINLERYHKALTVATNSMDQTVDDRIMDAFAEMHIFRWVRMICARHPQAEFAFLGTKADLLQHDRRAIDSIQQDLVGRFKAYARRLKDRMQRALQELQDARFDIQDCDPNAETTELDDQIASCEQILRKQPVLLSEELIAFSSAEMKYQSVAQGKLKALLMVSGSSVLLPPSYADLLRHAQQRRVSSQKLQPSFQEQVDLAFLPVNDFVDSVACSSKLMTPKDEMLAALHLLNDTGDIVWFNGVSDVKLLQERLFLDPMLVIEFIRQIVNHKTDANASVDGRVSHAQLQALPFWREVSSTTVQQLKELLLHLHLAYSAGKSKRMAWNSDLIVPVYWNRAAEDARNMNAFPIDEGLIECVRWEYSFEPAIPENLFEKLAVTTYSPLLRSERTYAGSSFIDRMEGEYSTRVAKEDDAAVEGGGDTIASALSISVAARARTLAWKQLVWYCMNLESLLKTYPGLLVTRCTVSQRGQRFNVDQLLSDQEHFTQLNICTDQEFLPAEMDWYTNKARQLKPVEEPTQPGPVKMWSGMFSLRNAPSDTSLAAEMALLRQDVHKLATNMESQSSTIERQFQRNEKHIDAAVNELQRCQISLITGMKNKAKFPSLWTLEYRGFERDGCVVSSLVTSLQKKVTTTVVVKFRSDLSGKCHHEHEPIAISAAKEVFSRFGEYIKVGLTLLSAATPDFCGKDVLGLITDECKRQLDRSMEFHQVLHRTGVAADPDAGPRDMDKNRQLGPNEVLTLLSCLLRLHRQEFQADDIPQLSGLVCGVVVKTGEYVWASRDEILRYGKEIVLAVDYSSRGEAPSIQEHSLAASVEILPTETLPRVVPVPPQHSSPTELNSKLSAHEDSVGTKGVLQAMRRRLSSSKAAVPTSEVQRYMLKIIGAKAVNAGRKQSPYCVCRIDTPGGEPLLQIQTSPHSNSGPTPSWNSQLFEVALPIDAARNSTITFIIKHGSVVGSSQLAQGRIPFVALKPGQSATHEVCLTKKDKPAGILEFSLEAFA